ncbi:hypothetical protein [Streptomyces griseus]|uniref:hypothetical protein n=1 Tax=Streptomyces griseus TaxID=1911 RepID=UPI001F3084CB|nr:hypothetical protein [Streptomyces griseus]
MSRDRYVDFLRAWAIVLVVVGHWLITAWPGSPVDRSPPRSCWRPFRGPSG